ncbi:MAG: hypothetical protein K0B37_09600 [Bacteroidales bacterium]|nr:hypothetical protein [Bacteroidales bacterium]
MAIRSSFRIILFLFICLAGFQSFAQFYSAGQDPASIRWKQINTENFQVIFPENYEEQAKYIADILEYSYEYATQSLNHKPRRVSVIVHNQTVISNGFVSWAPRRIELYTNPSASNDAHDWMEQLVLHEFRHVVQIDKLNQGITRLLGFIVGEQAVGAVLGLFVPMWFLEGDAVVSETAFTFSGRGRLPQFEQGLRAQILTRGTYSFDKAYFGSYKDHVPNYYELGYQLVSMARIENGSDVWSGVIDNVAQRPWSPIPFSRGMKRETGRNKDRHYAHTFTVLDSLWRNQKEKHEYTQGEIISKENKLFTQYTQAYFVNDSTIIALKTGLRDIPQIVKISSDGREKRLFAPGFYFSNAFHYAAGKLVWNEQRPDPRWEHRNWSEIMIYDLETGKRKRITDHGRFFAPALSPDGSRVAAVETTETSQYALVVLNAQTAEELFRFSYDGNDFIMEPAWHSNGDKIAIIALDARGKRIDIIDTHNHSYRNVLPASHTEISAPRFMGEDIIFTGAWSGINSIYRLKAGSAEPQKIISPVFGADFATTSDNYCLWSDYTSDGYRLMKKPISELKPVPLDDVEDHSPKFHQTLAQQEETVITEKNIPRNEHEVKPYSRLRNLFHLHSWAPAYIDGASQEAAIGASMLFQNKLSTSFATLGYQWDTAEETGKFSAIYSYKGWYPVVDLIAESGHRRLYYEEEEVLKSILWTENRFHLALSVPLRFQHNEYFFGLTPYLSGGLTQALSNRHTPDTLFLGSNQYFAFQDNQVYSQTYRLLGYRQKRSVARDVYPRSGQIFDIQYRHSPFTGQGMGSVFGVRGIVYLPGLFRHHGFRFSAGYQEKTRDDTKTMAINYSYGNVIPISRGYSSLDLQKLSTFTADYAFPILYPDLSIRHIIYLMRLRGHIFSDFARGTGFPDPDNNNLQRNYSFASYGFGIVGDMHLFRFIAPLSLGVEVAFPDGGDVGFQMLMGVRF